MTQFKIFKHPSGRIEAVKQGWSWPAFFFIGIWAMAKKMWTLGVSVFAVISGLGWAVVATGGDEGVKAIINLITIIAGIVLGMHGNSWREKNLLTRGYELKDTVNAANPEAAMALFLNTVQRKPIPPAS
jgi:hypothetical protein